MKKGTIITVTGVFKKQDEGKKRDYAEPGGGGFLLELPENLTEEKAVQTVFQILEEENVSLVRKKGYVGDRVDVRGGIMTGEPKTYVQPRDANGRFMSYDQIGRDLMKGKGPARDANGRFMSYADIGRAAGRMVTGHEAHTSSEQTEKALDDFRKEIKGLTWKTPSSGAKWRKQGVKRVKSPYSEEYQRELDI